MDIFCYTSALLVVVDFGTCENQTGLRNSWQWPLGAISISVTWLNLLSLIRKLPFIGIYVVMFTDVLKTFLKVSSVVLLFVVAFSLGFSALLENQKYFGDFPLSMARRECLRPFKFSNGLPQATSCGRGLPLPGFCFVLFCLCGGPVTAPLLNLSRNLSSK